MGYSTDVMRFVNGLITFNQRNTIKLMRNGEETEQ